MKELMAVCRLLGMLPAGDCYVAALRLKLAVLEHEVKRVKLSLGLKEIPEAPQLADIVDGLTSTERSMASMKDLPPIPGGGQYARSGKIEAIQSVRTRTGLGLKEAKDLVENWMQKHLGFRYWPN